MSNKKKQLTVMGTVWDFWSVLKMFDKLYESKYISFYEPWLKGEIDKEKIILFNEKSKNPLLWPFKILKRTYKILKIIREFKPDLVITHHDDANVSIIPVILLNKIFKISNNTKFILWVRNNPIESYKEGLYSKIIILAYKYFYKYADIIIVQTQENKKIIESHFKSLKNKTKIVPNVYEIDKLQQLSHEPLEKQYLNIFKDSFVF
ncbi:TPA: glycosyltransferase, partial [Methanocaldococcus jannaschii]|nr:glycosyltransferase [Methanocaldococcus jannaschii]